MYELFLDIRQIFPDVHHIRVEEDSSLTLVFVKEVPEKSWCQEIYREIKREGALEGSLLEDWFRRADAYLAEQKLRGCPVQPNQYSWDYSGNFKPFVVHLDTYDERNIRSVDCFVLALNERDARRKVEDWLRGNFTNHNPFATRVREATEEESKSEKFWA